MTWKILDEDSEPIKSKQELAHDQLFKDLDEIISKAAYDLEIPHILHVGLDYFVGLAYGLAKDSNNADLIIDKTIERAKNEYKPD
jgi:hypothetical protein